MKWILPINQPFKNLKQYTSIDGQSMVINSEDGGQKGKEGETKEDEMQNNAFEQFNKSSKKREKKWQTSFQKQFLTQHTITFKKQLQNFLEFALASFALENYQTAQTIRNSYLKTQSPSTLTHLLSQQTLPISSMHSLQFSKDIEHLDDLQNFLNHILKEYNQLLARELVAITIQIWIQFQSTDFKFQDRKQLLQKSSSWTARHASTYYQKQTFPYLNLKMIASSNFPPSADIEKFLNHFLRYFSTTILFILAGFFQNPYSGQKIDFTSETVSCPKRQLSFSVFGFLSCESVFSDEEESFYCKKHLKEQ